MQSEIETLIAPDYGDIHSDSPDFWLEEEHLSSIGIRWHWGDEYIFISKEDCDKYNEYEIIVPDSPLRILELQKQEELQSV